MLQALRRNGSRELWALLPSSFACWERATPTNASCPQPQSDVSTGNKHSYVSYRCIWGTRITYRSLACVACPPSPDALKDLQEQKPRSRGPKDVAFAAHVLEQISVNNLRHHLEQESERRIVIPLAELQHLIKEHGITDSEEDTIRIISALQTAGVILRSEFSEFNVALAALINPRVVPIASMFHNYKGPDGSHRDVLT
jgi:hypothetical protein